MASCYMKKEVVFSVITVFTLPKSIYNFNNSNLGEGEMAGRGTADLILQ